MKYLKYARYLCIIVTLIGLVALGDDRFDQQTGGLSVYVSFEEHGLRNTAESAAVADPALTAAVAELQAAYDQYQKKHGARIQPALRESPGSIRLDKPQNQHVGAHVSYSATGNDIDQMIRFLIAESLRFRIEDAVSGHTHPPSVTTTGGWAGSRQTGAAHSWRAAAILAILLYVLLSRIEHWLLARREAATTAPA